VLRVFSGKEPGDHTWDQVAEWMTEDLRECAEHGREHGVIIGVQNHWDFLKTAEQVTRLIQMVSSEWVGVVVDTGSFRAADPYKEIETAAPHAVNWQVKEHVDGREFKVRLDMKELVRIARRTGYRGYLPIETLYRDAPDYDPGARASELLHELRAAIRGAE
ncbi:MAG: TIM barrel protein, partial [Candidatus Latescibacteria bacterium]|nr:TIM barrel protein [Candidatus Latescibacterota bacterium]